MTKPTPQPDSRELEEILEEIALNYEHKDHKDYCIAGAVYREYRAKLDEYYSNKVSTNALADAEEKGFKLGYEVGQAAASGTIKGVPASEVHNRIREQDKYKLEGDFRP